MGSPLLHDADQPLGWSDSAALELGAAIGIPGGHPPLRLQNHPIPRRQSNHWGWLNAWDAARYVALVKEVEEANLDSGGGRRRVEVERQNKATSLMRKYNNMVLGGKVRAAVRMATNRGAGRP